MQFEASAFRYPGSDRVAVTGPDAIAEIRRGESLALVGENGSGKTTLIKLLTRLYAPTLRARGVLTAATCGWMPPVWPRG